MTSIRFRLFLMLLAATGVVWLSAIFWIQHSTRTEVNLVLDRRLQESAQMVASLIARSDGFVPADLAGIVVPDGSAPALPDSGRHDFARQLVCQVWGFDGTLKSGSDGAPTVALAGNMSGFTEREVDGMVWRVYTHVDEGMGIRVMVGDARSVRDRLVDGVILGLVGPAALILPMLAVLTWVSVRRGLSPLDALAQALSARRADDFAPLNDFGIVHELRPMVAALNGLFRRVETSRDRERSFTAFAAHELKTPLAGLKTQAQIAVLAPDQTTRSHALAQIATGVDRTDRMVRQLLDMVAAEDPVDAAGAPAQDGARILAEVTEMLSGIATTRGVRLDVHASAGQWRTSQSAILSSALRNLLENAVLASPIGATVEARMVREGDVVRFRILDRGPGIGEHDRPYVTDRFYRGANSPSRGGSGLGLSIVAAVVERMGGEFTLLPRPGGGEAAELILPAA
ncbi:sensor histidine kinase N-terminal domain-containing protein [Rhodobacteraceae bacterium HSP-20]|uniref:histidine kinase n=1 Tax=Paragemmobacter amnigenus TaxID=2852097 RepID=A0ABS6J5N4_9RHOB|nr:ATP-binding protein [Rhodobacter amnigenus]MBU9698845.1 sensor histidine kinase N-terminal domain-containing protein [Rhodobacter amnigenus]MBV4390072.1 sensor histidine kinase N-terminal domain-containing protein [Rhodobacter amnigenus]